MVPKMFNSAEKLVLLLMAAATCVGVLFRILDTKDFMILATMVFAFYYTKPAEVPDSTPKI